MIKVLFVCMGNICRSPTAEGVFRKLVREKGLEEAIEIDSAGTHSYHVGKPPDLRAQEAALRRSVDLSGLRGRAVTHEDLLYFDHILVMDEENYEALLEICPEGCQHKIRLLLEFAPRYSQREVPDPYSGGAAGFEHVLDMIEDATKNFLEEIR